MKTSKILGLAGTLTKSRKVRIAIVGIELAIMVYAYYITKNTNDTPRLE